MELSVLGGKGFVGGQYVNDYGCKYNNSRNNYEVYSDDVLYFISTVTNFNIYTDTHVDINTNLNVLMTVLDNWRERDPKGVFNFVSSWFVYGYGCGFEEHDECNPKGFYSITKRCAEQMLQTYCETFKLKYRILRLANVIGPGDAKASPQKNTLQFMANSLQNNEPVYLVKGGEFWREYIHVKDCAKAINLVVSSGMVNNIYNVGNTYPHTLKEAVNWLKDMSGSTSKIVITDGTAESFTMFADKLRGLGYYPDFIAKDMFKTLLKDSDDNRRVSL